MKKIFIALSVLAVVAFVAVPAQALIGMPDAVPGSQTLVPFWIVDINFNGDDTLVTLTNVAGVPADPRFDPAGVLHLEMYNSRSVIVHNETIPYTKYDVVGIDFGQIVRDNLSLASLASCAVDLDNDGTDDHYAGYAYVTDINYNFDHWIAHLYQLDLAGGMAAGVVIPVKEVNTGPCPQYDDSFLIGAGGDGGYEAFNSDAYTSAESMIAGLGCLDGWALRLMPRYYIHDAATGETQLIVWQSENLQVGAAFPIGGLIHINWFDEEEHKYSSDLDIPDELNIINIEYWLPGALKGDYPWAGWLDMPLIPAGAPGSPFIGASPWGPETQMMAYSWQLAVGAAQESWSVLFDVHRDAWGTLD